MVEACQTMLIYEEDNIMPNWCCTKYAFYTNDGDKGELLRFYKNLSDIILIPSEIKNDFEPGWLGKVAIRHGLDHEKTSCRGTINYLENYDPKDNFFTLESETAWIPADELWEAVIARYKGISFVYLAEEPGMEIFINTDSNGTYFPEKYLVEIFGDAPIPEKWYVWQEKPKSLDIREYFSGADDLMDYFARITGKSFSTIGELRTYLSDIFDEKADTLANIHEFTAA